MPPVKTTKTLMPIKEAIKTNRYGKTLIRLNSARTTAGAVSGRPKISSRAMVKIAAGRAIKKFVLNLSFISTPCVRVAAMVVSEIIERLSPNIAPPMVAPTTKKVLIPPASAKPMVIGVIAVTVPTEVPVASAINAEMTKAPAAINCGGITDIPRFTTESTPPIALETVANAPANR